MNSVWMRLVLTLEVLLAVPAVFTAWSQVGGQGHLDLMPWSLKLVLGAAACFSIAGFTAATLRRERFWTFRSAAWALLILLAFAGMGLATYYYHLQEGADDGPDGESTTAALLLKRQPVFVALYAARRHHHGL